MMVLRASTQADQSRKYVPRRVIAEHNRIALARSHHSIGQSGISVPVTEISRSSS